VEGPSMSDAPATNASRLQNLWDERKAAALAGDPLELLRYRSNLLGADLRITNFGGGNTSSKIDVTDPVTGETARVLAVKGSGGDLGSITSGGFALLRQDRLEALVRRYRGEAHEDEMVALYPLCAHGGNHVAASIDTPIHAFLPFAHIDHLHPDWAIAIAASANGEHKLQEFNARFGRHLIWIRWQRPGFELAMMLQRAVAEKPACDGIVLASHGLFTWGRTQQECYENSLRTIDQMGEFVEDHARRRRKPLFGGTAPATTFADPDATAATLLPVLRGRLSASRRVVAHWDRSPDALTFAASAWAADLCRMGTSCPDHFLRTRICPMFVPSGGDRDGVEGLIPLIDAGLVGYRREYTEYYQSHANPDSPALRDANPSVVVVPGLGVFGFGKDKREARITTEFFINAIHVMAGATALETEDSPSPDAFHNYSALPRREAFRIEYWALEEAKLRRQPPERELSRMIAIVTGGASGIGREVVLQMAALGAHLVVADQNVAGAEDVRTEASASMPAEMAMATPVDLTSRASIDAAMRATILRFGGVDIVVNTAAIFPAMDVAAGEVEAIWAKTLAINVTSNDLLARAAARVMSGQGLPASIVLTSSANAVVPKQGSEPYDVSKAAVNHLIRELAIGLGPLIRVNGVAPATVVAGSAMFPRDRVIASLRKYQMAFDEAEPTESLRDKLAAFYAQRTITRLPIKPSDCAHAIVWLAGPRSAKTTGHIIPVDGGLADAFLR
jgi:rhamnulose-1-phosphate aldolase/alcohol dehydrogenase